ncbi:hypothetical protein N431DRAFT_393582 [Stipitochalara longipes BDJ]|nr:hypothetical protein N431DRAFT_393582 [Stipitochalara longipes BDJ]
MDPRFPLQEPPLCRQCKHPSAPEIVREQNQNGHPGRRYFHCNHGCHRESKFVAWNDSQGIVNRNPRCVCGYTSRIGIRNESRTEFFHCPVGWCGFYQDVPPGYGAGYMTGAAGPPGYAMYAGPGARLAVQEKEERNETCCGCLVM